MGLKKWLIDTFTIEATPRSPEKTKTKRVGYAFVRSSSGGSARKNLESPTFDLEEISSAYNTESYVRQAVDKYVDLILKAGWIIKSKNEKASSYVRTRLSFMAEATDIETDILIAEIVESVVKYSNAFIIKARQKETPNMPGIKISGVEQGTPPVAGYFVLPPSTIRIARDKNGTVVGYEQKVPGQDKPLSIKPQDMIHISWKKPIGYAFGIPFVLPVLDDIRLLREIEDNVSNLLYKHLHPLYKFIVGLQTDGKESTPEEIELVKQMIEEMPMDGTLVLPERYDVEVVGAEGLAINADWALDYFEKRVFTGLGIPETVFGRAQTANKATADNLTIEMHDRIKAIQKTIAKQFTFRIVKELCLEGGFDFLLRQEDTVEFEFKEIAYDERIKQENHMVQMFMQNAITFEEMRMEFGRESEVDESRLYYNMFGSQKEDKTVSNKDRPENQHGKKLSPKKTASMVESYDSSGYGSFLNTILNSLKNEVIDAIDSGLLDQVPMYLSMSQDRALDSYGFYSPKVFFTGANAAKKDCRVTRDPDIKSSVAISQLQSNAAEDLKRFFGDLQKLINKAISKEGKAEQKAMVSAAFSSVSYRLGFCGRTQLASAFNYGYTLMAKGLGRKELVVVAENPCEKCKEMSKGVIKLNKKDILLRAIPPWHTNCMCQVRIRGDSR